MTDVGLSRVVLVIVLAIVLSLAGCVGDTEVDAELGDDEQDGDGEDADDQGGQDGDDQTAGGDGDDGTDDDGDADRTPPNTTTGSGDGVEIHHLDVGQADSTVIITPANETIVIDTGDWPDDGETVIEYLESLGVERIDHLLSTHVHADHIGGHAAVIEHFETERDGVGAVYDPGEGHTSQTFENYLDAVETHDVDLFEVQEGDRLPLAGNESAGTFLNPPAEKHDDELHPNGIALLLEFGELRYLTTGDVESPTEARILDAWGDSLDADVYQAGHHGSSTSSSTAFLDAVQPDVAVISSDVDSQYGHPHDEVLQRFAERDVTTYWTGAHGNVVLRQENGTIAVNTERDHSTDPLDLLDTKQGQVTASGQPAARCLAC